MNNNEIKNNIVHNISGDSQQLSVIDSDDKLLIVEAPAGYGKTFTMISKISYWFATNFVPKNKIVLCLSYSVSAANRMKESINSKFISKDTDSDIPTNIITTNFHGFCRNILRKYGFLIDINNIDKLESIDPSKITTSKNLKKELDIVEYIERDIVPSELA